jgi:hypothetical protein
MSSTTLETLRDANHTPAERTLSNHEKENPIIVEFDGADDPFDPKNFSNLKKWVVLIAVTHGAVVVTCASSLYVCSMGTSAYDIDCLLYAG